MLGDDPVTVRMRVLLGRGPREEVAANLNVVVGELAELVIVHTEELGFLAGAEVHAGDYVDQLGNDGRHDEAVSGRGADISDLDVELLIVMVGPASDQPVVDAIETNDIARAEKGVE